MLLKQHIKQTTLLALPLIVSQVGHIVTGMVDNIFLGHLGAISNTAQAAGGLANQLYVILLVFSIGVSYVLTPQVSQAQVDGDELKKASLFKHGLVVNVGLSFILFGILFLAAPLLHYMQQPDDVVAMADPFFKVLIFSIIPVSLFFVCKQYLEGLENTTIAMFISIGGNLLNIVLNYCLIYGKFGLPVMGYMGSCWATFIARCLMGVGFLYLIYRSKKFKTVYSNWSKVKVQWKEIKTLFVSGLNSGFQFAFEVSAFVVCALMIGSFGKIQFDAHTVAIGLASFTYMFGSGIGGASTIRVGGYVAKMDKENTKLAIKASFSLVWIVMGLMCLLFFALKHVLILPFSVDTEVLQLASQLLIIAAIFQLFDGMQVVALSILRGLNDYKIPTLVTLVAYWVVAIPLSYIMAFTFDLKAIGVWIALCVSLVLVAVALFWRIKYLQAKIN